MLFNLDVLIKRVRNSGLSGVAYAIILIENFGEMSRGDQDRAESIIARELAK